MTQLGSGTYAVTISEWSGRIIWQSIDHHFGAVSWAREKGEVTKATIEAIIPPSTMGIIEPWAHLLTIYRDTKLVWHGVILKTTATGNLAQIEAADGAVFFSRRRIPITRTWAQHDATQVMRTMVEDACGYLDATGIVESMATMHSRIWITATWEAADGMLDDAVGDLTDQGLAWTVTAGRLLIGPIGATHTTAMLQDGNFDGNMTIVKDGTEAVTDALIMGKGVWGQYSDTTSPIGMLQTIEKADGAVREEECTRMAKRIVDDAKYPPRKLIVPGGSRLMPTTPISMDELVPGVQVPVASTQTGVRVASTMEINTVDVKADDGGEEVSVTLTETTVTNTPVELPDPADLDWRSPYEKENANKHMGTATEAEEKVGIPPA